MDAKQNRSKSILKKAVNILFFGLLLLLVLSPDAKSWFLKQLITVGLFKAEITKDDKAADAPAAVFSFRDEKGNRMSTENLKGKVVFINFWATWCPPCRAEMPSLNNLYNQLKDDDRFVFLFMNEDEDSEKAKDFLLNNKYAFPLLTTGGNISSDIYTGTLPTSIVLNKEGKIVMKHEGLGGYGDDFLKQLKELL